MFKAATISRKKPFSRNLGRDLGKSLVKKLGDAPKAAWLFCAPEKGLRDLLWGINDTLGTGNIIGCTTDGEISSNGFGTGSAVLGGIVSDQIDFHLASVKDLGQDCERAGITLATKLPENVKYIQLFSDGLTGNGCAILRGLESVLDKTIPVCGGTAGDAGRFHRTWQFAGNRVFSNGAAAMGFSGNFQVGTGVSSGWSPIGLAKKVTRSVANILYELNGEPALNVYERALGKHAGKLPAVGVEYPLGIVTDLGDEGKKDYLLLRATMSVNRKEGSISFAGEIPEGSTVHITCGDSTSLLEAAKKAGRLALAGLDERRPVMIFIYSCMARRIILGRRVEEEINCIRRAVGPDLPVLGFYSYGEYGRIKKGGPNLLQNETVTVSVIGL
jgi:hypothetical protein